MVRYKVTADDGTEVVFREPREDDARQFMKLINGIVDERNSGIMIDKRARLRDERMWVKGRIEGIRKRRLVMLSAEVDGAIVGNCDVMQEGWKKSHRAVLGIIIARDFREKGIGESLMRKTIELAERRLKGIEFIDLTVLDYNKRAKGLYSKLGFVEIGRIPKGIKEGRRYYDEILMTREVSQDA